MKMRRKSIFFLTIFVLFHYVLLPSAQDAYADDNNLAKVEKYVYRAVPFNLGSRKEEELIEMEFAPHGLELLFVSKTVLSASQENLKMSMRLDGEFLAADKEVTLRGGGIRKYRIWRAGEKVYVTGGLNKNKKISEYAVPRGKGLAVDASLLILMRKNVFEPQKRRDIFMVDFSGHSVMVTLASSGVERVLVPAGEFECYRVEVIVNIPLLKPKITYWLTTEEPHFLVKQIGRHGPFSRTYSTELVEKQ